MSIFDEKYARLNKEQKQAVDALYGPVLVIAGPGSGKTELLAVRIAHILKKTDANPNNILCLTFTDNAANNMRERLARIIGGEAYKVSIHTFHTFGMEILNRFRHKIRENEELTTIDDIQSAKILHEINSKLLWKNPWKGSHKIHTIRNTIIKLKEASITSETLEAIVAQNGQILNVICSKIENFSEKIFSLGQKKEEKIQKIQLFHEMMQSIRGDIDGLEHIHLTQNIGATIYAGMEQVSEKITHESDAKPLTQWKNTWLEKSHQGWRFKERKKHDDIQQFLDIYQQYEKELKKNSLLDFSDMILRAIALIQNDSDVQAGLAEQYQWILVDEYQDTNDAQFSLLSSLLEPAIDAPNIFAVGDDDQSIYKFQGANIRNLELFLKRYEETQTIILKKNYRSHREIIDLSCNISSQLCTNINDLLPEIQKEFESVQGDGAEISYNTYENELSEIVEVSRDIEQKISNGVNPKDIAVIAKKNATLEMISKLLLHKNIPVSVSKEENIFENPAVILLIDMLEYIHSLRTQDDRDDLLVKILSHPMWDIHRLTLWEVSRQIFRAKKPENKQWIEVLRTHSDKYISKIAHFFIEISLIASHTRLETLIDFLTGVRHTQLSDDYLDSNEVREQPALFLEEIDENFVSPYYEYFFSEKNLKEKSGLYISYLLNIQKCIDTIRNYAKSGDYLKLEDFIEYMTIIREYDISLVASTLIDNPEAVQCITAHKAKGLEYDHVYAVHLTEKEYTRGRNTANIMPANISILPEKDNTDDLIRLIYTIFTRAKKTLTITFSKQGLNEKANAMLSVLAIIPEEKWSLFPNQISDDERFALETLSQDIFETDFSSQETLFLKNYTQSGLSISATALQNFLDVTSGGPKHFLSNNILRFPEAKHQNAVYGTAIHKGLEDFFKDYKFKGSYNKKLLIQSFEESIQTSRLEPKIQDELLIRGKENLEYYYDIATKKEYGELHLEYRFNMDASGIYLDENRLSGAIDRIEILSDGTLIVTDYKTGKGFESLALQGKYGYDAIKAWKYKLQLTFYALLFSLSPRWQAFKKIQFQIIFVEKDRETGKCYEIIEYIQSSEIERLTKILTKVIRKIQNLDFPDVSGYSQDVKGILQFEEDLLEGKNLNLKK